MAGRLRYLICLFVLGAMTKARAEAPAAGVRHLSFTVFSAQPITGLMYRARMDAASSPIDFYPTARSPDYDYQGPASVCFWDGASGRIVAEVTVPLGITSALFLFAASGSVDGGARYQVRVLDDGLRSHAAGELRVLNYSGLNLSGTINRKRVMLPDGSALSPQVGRSADILLRAPFKDKSFQAYAETIPVGETGRALLILLPPYRPGALEVQSRLLLDAPAVTPQKMPGGK